MKTTSMWEKEFPELEDSKENDLKIENNNLLATKDDFQKLFENEMNSPLLHHDSIFTTKDFNNELKDSSEMKEILLQLKFQSQKKDEIILNLRQQIKQLIKTMQLKEKIIQKNNDTVSLVFHIIEDNLSLFK